jgi:hypothetical protein
MPYQKTKEGRLVNEITLGDGYPLSNDLQPLKIGGEASVIEISHPLPDGSDNGLFKVNGDLDITGTLKTKLSHDLIYDFDDEVNTLAQAKVDALIDSAPAALDTLNELAAALGDDANFATTVTNSLALKAPLAAPAFTGDATFDSTTLTIDSSNNRVGIGTASPVAALTVKSNNTSSANSGFTLMDNSNTNPVVQIGEKSTDGGRLHMYDGGTLKVSLYTDGTDNFINAGNVCIGTTSPDSPLHVQGAGDTSSTKSFEVDDSGGTNLFYIRDDGMVSITHNYLFAQASGGIYSTGSIKARGGITDDLGDLGLGSGGNVDHMTISGGNVGIGNTSPNHLLHVGDDATAAFVTNPDKAIQLSSTTNDEEIAYILYSAEGSNNIRSKYFIDDDIQWVGWDSTYSSGLYGYKWQIAGNDKMALTSAGNLGIGTESPAEKLHVVGNLKVVGNISSVSGGASIGDSAADVFRTTGHTYLATVDNNVGIGTTSPTTKLDVEGTVSYKETTLSASSDAFDVSDATVVKIDTSGGTILLGGLSGGVAGQVIHLAKTASANSIRIEHNESTGTQKIFTSAGFDKTISGYGGLSMYCDGTSWYTLDS